MSTKSKEPTSRSSPSSSSTSAQIDVAIGAVRQFNILLNERFKLGLGTSLRYRLSGAKSCGSHYSWFPVSQKLIVSWLCYEVDCVVMFADYQDKCC
uniref:Uncharacterized protein n=1 Tax=Onchocerca volvulus TaxID=6282 RepID=A0A8R1TU65_ONCVO